MIDCELYFKNNTVNNIRKALTENLRNIKHNSNFLMYDGIILPNLASELYTLTIDISGVIYWYSKSHVGISNKELMKDYIKDYEKLDNRFLAIVNELPSIYNYNLCLKEHRFKIFKD